MSLDTFSPSAPVLHPGKRSRAALQTPLQLPVLLHTVFAKRAELKITHINAYDVIEGSALAVLRKREQLIYFRVFLSEDVIFEIVQKKNRRVVEILLASEPRARDGVNEPI